MKAPGLYHAMNFTVRDLALGALDALLQVAGDEGGIESRGGINILDLMRETGGMR
jgi:hypothetical protein